MSVPDQDQNQNSWRTAEFRQNVVQKIEEAIQRSGMPTAKNSVEMENHVFQKAKNKEEYLGFVARLILHVREMSTGNQGGVGGSGGNMMGLGPPQGPPQGVTATNLLQTLNTRPQLQKLPPGVGQMQQGIGQVQMQGGMGPMGPGTIQGQIGGPMQNQMGGPMQNQMGGSMQNQMGGPMQNPMGGPMQNQMGGPMQNQMGGPIQNTMGGPMQNQMGSSMQNQMGGTMQNQMGGPIQNQLTNNMQSQMGGPMQNQMGGPMQNQMGGPMQNQMGGPMQSQMGGPMQNQMGGPMQNQIGGPLQNQMGGGQMGSPLSAQMSHMVQKRPDPNMMMNAQAGFTGGPRSMNAQFIRQTPTPPQPSPVGMQHSQMVASPALVPSPSAPLSQSMPGQMRSVGMAPSPSGSLNTPGQAQPTSSPCPTQEDQVYRDKIRQLSKYIEPLRRMIARAANDDIEKTTKMKKLLEILQSPNKRMPLETLLKCEHVLEKLDFKHSSLLRDHHPLLEAVSGALQSSNANHTLQRTFGPCLEILSGPLIKDLPLPVNRKRVEEPADDVPEVLQGEIARLDQRFKVSLDPTQQSGSKAIQLVCWLDDRHLPCVPPIQVSIPEDYPSHPPRCTMGHEHNTTPFLTSVKNALESRIKKLPLKYSVSQLLDTWEMSVRQACAPPTRNPTSSPDREP
ncbi:hypothetical protein M8J77_018420 [Diaphorina citri]|nr:hypothetical protein M8J77_018420 [Diaphorina citri]